MRKNVMDKSQLKTTWLELSQDEKELFWTEPVENAHSELKRKGVDVEMVLKNFDDDIKQGKDLDYFDEFLILDRVIMSGVSKEDDPDPLLTEISDFTIDEDDDSWLFYD